MKDGVAHVELGDIWGRSVIVVEEYLAADRGYRGSPDSRERD